jgi:integrase
VAPSTAVDECRNPRTSATVNQMLDRHFELTKLAPATLSTYVGYAAKHIRPLIGAEPVGRSTRDLFDSFYAELRRCRDHCDRRPRIDHRTAVEHVCDGRCGSHLCRPLGDSTIRQVHFILSGALRKAVRWRWIGASPIGQAEPPTAAEAARILSDAWSDVEWALLGPDGQRGRAGASCARCAGETSS